MSPLWTARHVSPRKSGARAPHSKVGCADPGILTAISLHRPKAMTRASEA